MSGSKRQRELARAKYERQQARRAQRVDKKRRNQRIVAAVVVTALVFAGVGWAVLASRSSAPAPVAAATPTASALPTSAPSASAAPSASVAPTAATAAATTEATALNCKQPGTPRTDVPSFSAAPADATGKTLTLTTNCGDIVIALDPKAPKTVSSEVFLAKSGFYDKTTCHRLTTSGIFVLQCGDPEGTGRGGPGYTLAEENLPAEGANNYPAGTVAMANAGPGTTGSQFFVVYEDTTLPAGYTVWGKVTSGLDIVKEIASAGVADGGTDGAPKQAVFIESATVQS